MSLKGNNLFKVSHGFVRGLGSTINYVNKTTKFLTSVEPHNFTLENGLITIIRHRAKSTSNPLVMAALRNIWTFPNKKWEYFKWVSSSFLLLRFRGIGSLKNGKDFSFFMGIFHFQVPAPSPVTKVLTFCKYILQTILKLFH